MRGRMKLMPQSFLIHLFEFVISRRLQGLIMAYLFLWFLRFWDSTCIILGLYLNNPVGHD